MVNYAVKIRSSTYLRITTQCRVIAGIISTLARSVNIEDHIFETIGLLMREVKR